jgi:hypothetical protein
MSRVKMNTAIEFGDTLWRQFQTGFTAHVEVPTAYSTSRPPEVPHKNDPEKCNRFCAPLLEWEEQGAGRHLQPPIWRSF